MSLTVDEMRCHVERRSNGYLPLSPKGDPVRHWAEVLESAERRIVELENQLTNTKCQIDEIGFRQDQILDLRRRGIAAYVEAEE